jgi:hypothetical protein
VTHVCIMVDTVCNQCHSWPFELLHCHSLLGNRPDNCTTEALLMHRINGSKGGSNFILELDTIPRFTQGKRNLLTEASVGSGQRAHLAPSSCRRAELSGFTAF